MYAHTHTHTCARAVKRSTVKYAVIESDVLALLLRDFVLEGGHGNRELVEREPKKDEMFFWVGPLHCI